MKMTSRLASLLVLVATSSPLLSATEVERLRALCAEQELQIHQLETRISQLTDTPPPARRESAPAVTSSDNATTASAIYIVKPGDSLERIANHHAISVSSLAKLNGLKPGAIIHPGQELKTGSASTPTPVAEAAPAKLRTHTIQTGDTLYKISRKYGVSVDELMTANPGIDPKSLRVGDTINISTPAPRPEPSVAETPAPKPAPSLASAPAQPVSNAPAKKEVPRTPDQPVKINTEITYDEFARNYRTTTQRLDELNGLKLDPDTVLAQGSELYIPAQP